MDWIPVTSQGYLCVYVHEEAILCVLIMDSYDLMMIIMMMMTNDDDDEDGDLNHIISNHEGVDVKARHFLGHVLRDLTLRKSLVKTKMLSLTNESNKKQTNKQMKKDQKIRNQQMKISPIPCSADCSNCPPCHATEPLVLDLIMRKIMMMMTMLMMLVLLFIGMMMMLIFEDREGG